jgi:hypothetical protein
LLHIGDIRQTALSQPPDCVPRSLKRAIPDILLGSDQVGKNLQSPDSSQWRPVLTFPITRRFSIIPKSNRDVKKNYHEVFIIFLLRRKAPYFPENGQTIIARAAFLVACLSVFVLHSLQSFPH